MSNEIMKIGRVVEVSGSKVIGALQSTVDNLYRTYKSRRYAIGQVGSLVKIESGDALVFGIVTALRMTETSLEGASTSTSAPDARWLEIELFGEALRTGIEESDFDFQRGVTTYPMPGQNIFVASISELSQIYRRPNKKSIKVGTLSQATSLPVHLLMDELLGKHFAVLGTTGSGKSCSVTVLLRSILQNASGAHIILLDPHNEYAKAFQDHGEYIDPTSLNLPHWLLNFQESVELYIGRTERTATNQTNILKDAILDARRKFSGTSKKLVEGITVDTPVPYSLDTLVGSIKEQMPPQASKQDSYQKVLNKIETLRLDKRFSFLFSPDDQVKDNLSELIKKYIRIPTQGKPISIIDLSGVPSDVVDVVVSVLCRTIFDFAVWSARPVEIPILLVCEEAHRYVPQSETAAFQPTRQALSRIAKEGRKYGVGLGLISQRPSEVSESILSQCNTIIALRMSNKRDQEFVEHALPDSVSSLVSVLPSLRTQEALVVGEGTAVPVRLRFNNLSRENRPQSLDVLFSSCWSKEIKDEGIVNKVIENWRQQKRGKLGKS